MSLVFTWKNVTVVLSSKQVLSVSFKIREQKWCLPHWETTTCLEPYEVISWDFWLLRRVGKRDTMQGIELWNWGYVEGIYRIRETCKKGRIKEFWFQMFREGDFLVCRPRRNKSFSPHFLCSFSLISLLLHTSQVGKTGLCASFPLEPHVSHWLAHCSPWFVPQVGCRHLKM